MLSAALPILALAGAVQADVIGCGGHRIDARNHGMGNPHWRYAREYSETNEDVAAQCAPYNYPPMAQAAAQFPANWQPAKILPDDQEANDLFKKINQTVTEKAANIKLKQGTMGDFSATQYSADDPDCWWTKSRCTSPKIEGVEPDHTTLPEPETWGFGFDDGPNCSHNALYNFLKEKQQKGTMFYIGSNVMNWPQQAIRGYKDGHELCVHTWSHSAMTTLTNDAAFAELWYTRKVIKHVTGVTPKCWRPPYGDVDDRIRIIAQGMNLTNILWSDDTFDWQVGSNGITEDTIKQNYQKVFDKAKNGTFATHGPIVLNHEINNFTMQEMINQYPTIQSTFKHIVPIASGLNLTHPYEEANETYPNFDEYINNKPASGDGGSDSSASGSGTASGGAAKESGSKGSSASPRAAAGGLFAVVAGAVALLL